MYAGKSKSWKSYRAVFDTLTHSNTKLILE